MDNIEYLTTELNHRRKVWPDLVSRGQMDNETMIHRISCLQDARLIARSTIINNPYNPALLVNTKDDIIAELRVWARIIQRDATVSDALASAAKIKTINTIIETLSPGATRPDDAGEQKELF